MKPTLIIIAIILLASCSSKEPLDKTIIISGTDTIEISGSCSINVTKTKGSIGHGQRDSATGAFNDTVWLKK